MGPRGSPGLLDSSKNLNSDGLWTVGSSRDLKPPSESWMSSELRAASTLGWSPRWSPGSNMSYHDMTGHNTRGHNTFGCVSPFCNLRETLCKHTETNGKHFLGDTLSGVPILPPKRERAGVDGSTRARCRYKRHCKSMITPKH